MLENTFLFWKMSEEEFCLKKLIIKALYGEPCSISYCWVWNNCYYKKIDEYQFDLTYKAFHSTKQTIKKTNLVLANKPTILLQCVGLALKLLFGLKITQKIIKVKPKRRANQWNEFQFTKPNTSQIMIVNSKDSGCQPPTQN